MSKPVIKAIIDQNFNQVLNLFEQHEVRHLPVLDVDTDTDEEFLVGLIPNRDVLRQLFPGYGTLVEKGIEQISVRLPCSDVFCRNIETTAPSGLLFPTIEKMSQMKIDCLPVVDESKLAIGMIASTDILRAFVRISKLSLFVKFKDKSNQRLIDLRTTRMRKYDF